MYKFAVKILGTVCVVLALVSLFFTIYHTNIDGSQSWLMSLKGINVVEFSAWGSLVVTLPLLMVGVMYTKLNDKIKMISCMGIYALSNVSLYNANHDTREWFYSQTSDFVYSHNTFFYYAAAIFVASLLFYICCNMNTSYNKA